MKEYPWGKGTPTWVRDATLNDSDKSFTVPTGKVHDLKFVYVQFAATATVGSRTVAVVITDGTNEVLRCTAGSQVTASATARFIFGQTTMDGYTGTTSEPLPGCLLPAGYVVRVYDVSAIDAAADDMTVVLHYVEYDA